jgi:hypothetical protein
VRFPWEFESPSCSDADTFLFFSKDKDDPDFKVGSEVYRQAKKVCNSCKHKKDCAEYGINYEIYGMWGGLTPRERDDIRTVRRLPTPNRHPVFNVK